MKTIAVTAILAGAIGFGVATVMPETNHPAEVKVQTPKYTSPERNYDGIQYEDVRRRLDPLYNAVHDELSAAYYNGTPFRDKGVLTNAQFEKYQAALWAEYETRFSKEMEKAGKEVPLDYSNGTTTKEAMKLNGYELTF